MTQYVILNPTGNLTALVLRTDAPEQEVTARLMQESEQVAYLEPPSEPGALAAIRLMGGEFCGNAAMAAAAWLIRDQLPPDSSSSGQKWTVPLQVSGAPGLVCCRIRERRGFYEGTVEMPPVLGFLRETVRGIPLTGVRMEGIVHWIRESDTPLPKAEAEALIRELAALVPSEAVGFLDRNTVTGVLCPLVWVAGSGTLVWETACGSGSAAISALEALRKGGGPVTTAIPQPGGVIRAEAEAKDGRILRVAISGRVCLGEIRTF